MDRTGARPTRRRIAALLGAAAIALAACTGTGSGAATPSASAPASAPSAAASAAGSGTAAAYEVTAVQDPKLGAYLAGEDGKTLYVFLKDSGGSSACTGQCATNWPPFTLDAGESVKPGAGVTGSFATITRADGTVQVTYMGAPLYYFAKDAKAGDVNGQGISSVWYVAAVAGGPGGAPSGGASAAPSAAASAASSSTSKYGYGMLAGGVSGGYAR